MVSKVAKCAPYVGISPLRVASFRRSSPLRRHGHRTYIAHESALSNSANVEDLRFESFTRRVCVDADAGLVVIASAKGPCPAGR